MPTGGPTPTPATGPEPVQFWLYIGISIVSAIIGGIIGYVLHG
jgi:hypothetical protein